MRIIKLLGFYLLFSLPFVVCAEQKNVNTPDLITEINKLCSVRSGSDFDDCVARYMNLDASIIDNDEMRHSCTEFSQAGMFDCLNIKAEYSENLLDKFEYEIDSPLSRVARQAFFLYRDAHCALVSSIGAGAIAIGTRMFYPSCIAVQNNMRIALLNKIILNKKRMLEEKENLATPDIFFIDGRDLEKKCGWEGAVGEKAVICLQNETEESFQALKQAEVEIFRAIAKWDEYAHYIVIAKGKLKLATQIFYLYRDAHCEFEISLTYDDRNNDTIHSMCIAEMNQWQASQLHDLALILQTRQKK